MSEAPAALGPYRILHRLGAGGMGVVFLAHDDRLDRQVALKLLHPEASRTPEVRERFRREARLAAQLNHPAIVHLYDVVREGEHDALVMEYVPGTTLRARLLLGGATLGQRLRWASQIAAGMAAAHDAGIIHRDLKTENILITPGGDAKITDFGIARQQGSERLTADSAILGTFRAMSPEQATGQPLDHRTDLFSFGVLLYETFAAVSPFVAEGPLALLERVVHAPHQPLGELAPELPAALVTLVDRLLAKQPVMRSRDFAEVGRALDALLAEAAAREGEDTPPALRPAVQGAPVATAGAPDKAAVPLNAAALVPGNPSSRTRRWVGAGLLGLVACGALGVWILVAGRAHRAAPGAAPVAQASAAPAAPLYVAVLAPEVDPKGDADLALRAASVRLLLEHSLTSLEGLAVSAAADVDRVQTPATSLKAVATALAASELVSTRIVCPATICSITLARIRGQDGVLLWTDSLQIDRDAAFYGLFDAVGSRVRLAYRAHRVRPEASALEVSAPDFERFVRLQNQHQRRDPQLTPERLHAELAGIRERSPGFLPAYLFEIDLARIRYEQASRAPADLERARQLLAVVRRIASGRREVGVAAFKVAMAANQLDQAAAELDTLARQGTELAVLWQLRAELLARRGALADAVTLLRKAAAVHPSWRILRQLARFELQRGERREARKHYEALRLLTPDNYDVLQSLAQLELVGGDPERAVALYTRLVARAPDFLTLGNLGIALLLAGRTHDAQAVLSRAHALEPRNPAALFNLADAEQVAGAPAQAHAHYREALGLLAGAPDADWPSRLARAQALGHVGDTANAVRELQAALRLAPADNADVAYAAAVVHALAGDGAACLVNVDAALRLGYAPRWFAFPWFDAVRNDARFVALMGRADPAK